MMIATAAHLTADNAEWDYPTPQLIAVALLAHEDRACDCGIPTGYYHESDCASRA